MIFENLRVVLRQSGLIFPIAGMAVAAKPSKYRWANLSCLPINYKDKACHFLNLPEKMRESPDLNREAVGRG